MQLSFTDFVIEKILLQICDMIIDTHDTAMLQNVLDSIASSEQFQCILQQFATLDFNTISRAKQKDQQLFILNNDIVGLNVANTQLSPFVDVICGVDELQLKAASVFVEHNRQQVQRYREVGILLSSGLQNMKICNKQQKQDQEINPFEQYTQQHCSFFPTFHQALIAQDRAVQLSSKLLIFECSHLSADATQQRCPVCKNIWAAEVNENMQISDFKLKKHHQQIIDMGYENIKLQDAQQQYIQQEIQELVDDLEFDDGMELWNHEDDAENVDANIEAAMKIFEQKEDEDDNEQQ